VQKLHYTFPRIKDEATQSNVCIPQAVQVKCTITSITYQWQDR